MDLIKMITRFGVSLIESLIVTFSCNIIFVSFSGININLDNLMIFFNRNLNIFLILLLIFLILFYQRKRMTESRKLYGSNPKAVSYGTSFFPYNNLLWEICIERSDFVFTHPPYFNYYVGRPLCPNPKDKRPCLTPLIISDNLICYTEYCAICKKKYLRFKAYDNDKYEIQTIIDSLILNYNVQQAEELVEVIQNYINEKFDSSVEN